MEEGPVEDRGCFLCRDGSCFEQSPPERDPCVSSVDCALGEICTDMGCIGQCSDPIECPIGTTCDASGLCLNPNEPDPTPREDEPPVDDPPVDDPPDDPEPTGFCPETECQSGRVCRDGQCRTPCVTDDDCARVDSKIRFCRDVEGELLCVLAAS